MVKRPVKYLIVAGLACLSSLALVCGKKAEDPAAQEERTTVTRVDLRDVISQTGDIQPVTKVDIKSEASGVIEKIYIKAGQRVSKGDKILEIDPTKLLNRKKSMDLTLRSSQIQKETAESDYRDLEQLVATGTVSGKALLTQKNKAELAAISYEQLVLDMQDLEDQLARTTVRSPMTGVLTDLLVTEGEIAVSATSNFQNGTAIGTVADISKLEVITKIGEVDYVHLKLGQRVLIKPEALENVQTRGTIYFIALNAKKANNAELGTFEVRISIDSLIYGIAPGINVNVEFLILDKPQVLGVPCHYVTKRPDGTATILVAVGAKGEAGPRGQGAEGHKRDWQGGGGPGGGEGLSEAERAKRKEEWQKKRAARQKERDQAQSKDKSKGKGQETLETRTVTLGATDYKHYEIIDGLREGEVVVFRPEIAGDKKAAPGGMRGGGVFGGGRR
jgi:HlyD family secretion protein